MIEKMIDSLTKRATVNWKILPLILWLFLAVLWILAYDPLSLIQAEAQKLWSSIASFSPLIIKYGTAVIFLSFISAVVFYLLAFLLWVKAKLEKQGETLMAMGGFALWIFIYTGSICVAFLVLANPSAIWNFDSLADDLIKFAASLYLLLFCWANHRGFLEILRKGFLD